MNPSSNNFRTASFLHYGDYMRGGFPGPPIVECLGDWVEVTLKHPADSKHAHNTDFDVATGVLSESLLIFSI